MASCSNHRLLKIAQLSKGKMRSPGRPCLTLTSEFWIPGPGAALWPPPGPGLTVPHWKMEQDQEQAGEWRVGL